MAATMRIDIAVGQVASAANAFRQAAAGGQPLVDLQERLVAGYGAVQAAAKGAVPLPGANVANRLNQIADALQNVAAGYELVKTAQQGVDFNAPSVRVRAPRATGTAASSAEPPAAGSAPAVKIPVGPEQRVARLEQALESVKNSGDAAQLADTQAALARALEQRDQQRERVAGNGAAEQAERSRIGMGPRELLEEIRQELARTDLSDARRGDLEDRRFRAERSIILNERRRANEDESLNRPGLLELFGDLNGILKDIRGGDVLGVATKAQRTLGFQVIPMNTPGAREREGGLNIEQLLAVSRGSMLFGGRADSAATDVATQAAGAAVQTAEAVAAEGAAAAGAANALAASLPMVAVAGAGVAAALVAGVALMKTAFDAFRRVIEETAADLRAFREGQLLSGGTRGQVSTLAAFGIEPGSIAAIGQRLRDSANVMNADPYRMLGAQQLGIGPTLPVEMGGRTNSAEMVLTAIDQLRQIQRTQGDEGALRAATRAQVTELLRYTQLSDRTIERMRRLAQLQGEIYSDANTRAAMELEENLRLFHDNATLLVNTLATSVIRQAADDLGRLVDVVLNIGETARRVAAFQIGRTSAGELAGQVATIAAQDAVVRFAGPLGPTIRTIIAGSEALKAALRIAVPNSPKERNENALERNTQAVSRMADNLEVFARGFTGGGDRAERSLTLRGYALRRALEEKTLRSRAPVL